MRQFAQDGSGQQLAYLGVSMVNHQCIVPVNCTVRCEALMKTAARHLLREKPLLWVMSHCCTSSHVRRSNRSQLPTPTCDITAPITEESVACCHQQHSMKVQGRCAYDFTSATPCCAVCVIYEDRCCAEVSHITCCRVKLRRTRSWCAARHRYNNPAFHSSCQASPSS